MNIISQFRGKYEFLSNFYESYFTDPVVGDFCSVEQYFQWIKAHICGNLDIAAQIMKTASPSEAKRLGKSVELTINWSTDTKLNVMKTGLLYKFAQNPDLKDKLIETSPNFLMEGNTWKDRFWGVDLNSGTGLNWLGLLLMELRNNLMIGKY